MSDLIERANAAYETAIALDAQLLRNKATYEIGSKLILRIAELEAALIEIRDFPEEEDGRLDSMEAVAREALENKL